MLLVDIKNWLLKKEISFLQLQFVDVNGELKALEVPVKKIKNVYHGKIMIDGSSISGFANIKTSDLWLKPDWTTLLEINFLSTNPAVKVARVLCDVCLKDGLPFAGSPRTVLKNITNKYLFEKIKLMAGFEAEFFLVKNNADYIWPLDKSSYCASVPSDVSHEVRREIAFTLQQHGFNVETLHKEVGPGQHEINFTYSNALQAADNLVTFKWIVQTISKNHGCTATFMPKPFQGVNGSGMHTNISVFKNNKNIFARSEVTKINEVQQYFIGGILNRVRELTAVTNPTVNSYKRLVPGYEAPNIVSWSLANRSTLVRVPNTTGVTTRVEVRHVDACANPYLVLSVLFEAGFEGIKDKRTAAVSKDDMFQVAKLTKSKKLTFLPSSLGCARTLLQKSQFALNVLGQHVFKSLLKIQKKEWNNYKKTVHKWEIEKYLNR